MHAKALDFGVFEERNFVELSKWKRLGRGRIVREDGFELRDETRFDGWILTSDGTVSFGLR